MLLLLSQKTPVCPTLFCIISRPVSQHHDGSPGGPLRASRKTAAWSPEIEMSAKRKGCGWVVGVGVAMVTLDEEYRSEMQDKEGELQIQVNDGSHIHPVGISNQP